MLLRSMVPKDAMDARAVHSRSDVVSVSNRVSCQLEPVLRCVLSACEEFAK